METKVYKGQFETDAEAAISALATEGLAETEVVEKHFHGGSRWFGATGAGGVAPGLQTSLLPFKAVSNAVASTFGTAILILDGTEDFIKSEGTPLYFDPHELFVVNVEESNAIWKVRFANSQWTGTADTYANMAAAVAAKKYTDMVIKVDDTKSDAAAIMFMSGRIRVGSKLWCQVMKNTADAKYFHFILGCHTYQE